MPLAKETALIYGNLKDSNNNLLTGVSLFAGDSNNQYEGSAVTDPNGAAQSRFQRLPWVLCRTLRPSNCRFRDQPKAEPGSVKTRAGSNSPRSATIRADRLALLVLNSRAALRDANEPTTVAPSITRNVCVPAFFNSL